MVEEPKAPHPAHTLERHVLESLRESPKLAEGLGGLLRQLSLAAKIIHSRVHRAGLSGVLGLTGETNVQGEAVAKLDEFANRTIVRSVEAGGYVCVMGSEEVDEVIAVPERYRAGDYVLLFDPLDGSGNIDINASIGTIFSIHKRVSASGCGTVEDCLQPGRKQVAAGYAIYGSSTMFVYTTGKSVHGFTFEPSVGEFFLSHEDIRMPPRGNTYSINEGNYHKWAPGVRAWVDWIKTPDGSGVRPYSSRYIGAMVADFHRTLLRGGVFAYPGDAKKPEGKLRLLYEVAPLAFVAEAAGGVATNGSGPVLDIVPTKLHQRTPLFVGSREDMAELAIKVGR